MSQKLFVFYFYEVKNSWGSSNVVSRGLRVENDDHGRYGRYFLSLWFEMPDVAYVSHVLAQLYSLESQELPEICVFGDEWDVYIKLDCVTFVSNQFDGWNDGVNNVFSYAEFKVILVAWYNFLSIPIGSIAYEYIFFVPVECESVQFFNHIELIRRTPKRI